MAENIHEESARWRKVAKLIVEVYAHGVPVDEATWLGDEQWKLIAQSAGVKPPSTGTIDLLNEILCAANERTVRTKLGAQRKGDLPGLVDPRIGNTDLGDGTLGTGRTPPIPRCDVGEEPT